jgi:acyl carrier protein phosphodiesterase
VNLLAHLHLSEGRSPAETAGNLLADFLRRFGAAPPDDAFAAGVRLHRAIDAFAEAHPRLRPLRARFSPARRRLGGIILDVAGDHFLAQEWAAFSPVPLRAYVADRLAAVQRHLRAQASPLGPLLDRAIAEEWLLECGTLDGLGRTFLRISRRSPAAAPLRGAEEEIERHWPALRAAFADFYPQLRARCAPPP